MHRSNHMRTTVRTLVNHRHNHTHRPTAHRPLSPGHTTHPPSRRPERHLQPTRIPITTSRPRHKLPTELDRIMKRHKRLQAIHLKTVITGNIIGLVHPRQEPIPSPNRLTPRYRICNRPHPRLHRIPRVRPHLILRKRLTEKQTVRAFTPKQPNGTLPLGVVGEETGEIKPPGNRSIVDGIRSQERGQLGRDKLLISTRVQHHPSIRGALRHLYPQFIRHHPSKPRIQIDISRPHVQVVLISPSPPRHPLRPRNPIGHRTTHPGLRHLPVLLLPPPPLPLRLQPRQLRLLLLSQRPPLLQRLQLRNPGGSRPSQPAILRDSLVPFLPVRHLRLELRQLRLLLHSQRRLLRQLLQHRNTISSNLSTPVPTRLPFFLFLPLLRLRLELRQPPPRIRRGTARVTR